MKGLERLRSHLQVDERGTRAMRPSSGLSAAWSINPKRYVRTSSFRRSNPAIMRSLLDPVDSGMYRDEIQSEERWWRWCKPGGRLSKAAGHGAGMGVYCGRQSNFNEIGIVRLANRSLCLFTPPGKTVTFHLSHLEIRHKHGTSEVCSLSVIYQNCLTTTHQQTRMGYIQPITGRHRLELFPDHKERSHIDHPHANGLYSKHSQMNIWLTS